MPAKWSRRVFSFRFYEGEISVPVTLILCLPKITSGRNGPLRSVRFEYRYAKGGNERFPELANQLVHVNVDVILTWSTDAVLASNRPPRRYP
jgi:hypothetical protein